MNAPARAGAPAVPHRHRPALFTLLLGAFALVIVLGVGGMGGFYSLAGAQLGPPTTGNAVLSDTALQDLSAQTLAGYYMAHNSWDGVTQSLDTLYSDVDGTNQESYTLLDADGRVVAGAAATSSSPRPGIKPPDTNIPIQVNGQQVGTLYLSAHPGIVRSFGHSYRPNSDVVRGIISAGLALAAVLLGLAAFFARRLSRPLNRLTAAAQTLAAGDLGVRVQGGPVREIDELAGAFNRMADSLAHADQQRRQLTADVAHELRTPLAIMRARLEGIQDGIYRPTPDQVTALLETTALLERLIEDLRTLALADAGQLPLYQEALDPIQLLHGVAQALREQARAGGVAVRVVADGDLPDVQADPQRIAQVLSNLVSNALRYTPAGGAVTLRAWCPPAPGPHPPVLFAVEDTGIGIAPADLPHIFDRFWRADSARARGSGGAGLGLAIARRIVEAHGGQIWASSAPGQGTTFSFSLPRAAPEPALVAAK